ncbi:MAG: FlgO family outer membrane protein [bacterium]
MVNHYAPRWATYDIRGWDRFVSKVGIDDGAPNNISSSTVNVEVDGNAVTKITVRKGEKAILLDIPLTNCSTLTLRTTEGIWFANPLVIKGAATPTTNNNIPGVPPPVINAPATFVVDPGDLDKLATSLRKRVDAKAELKDKIAKGFMSVMTFNLIDIPSPSVAQNVAEDIATKLINADFQLVERGQLDKALKELKIQDSALIDQKTAQQLGQITGCNYILVGSVSDRGQFIVMNARILETATGKAVAAESVECRKIEIKR